MTGTPAADPARSALAHLTAGDFAAAAATAAAALAIHPDDVALNSILANALMWQGAHAAALGPLARIVDLRPDLAAARYNLAVALCRCGRHAEREAQLVAAVGLDPGLADARLALGLLRLEQDRPADAVPHFAAAAADPRHAPTAEPYARIAQALSDPEALMRSGPPVSVVVPCFNYGRFVGEAVASALDQSYPNLEVVLVEGGSTDGTTPAQVAALAGPRVRVLARKAPAPAGDNRNVGIAAARGELIACLDADDRFRPDYILKAVAVLTALQCDIVGCSVTEFDGAGRRRDFKERPTRADLAHRNELPVTALFRRTWWETAGGFRDMEIPGGRGHLHEDWEFWYRLLSRGASAFNIGWQALVEVRGHADPGRLTLRAALPPEEQARIIRDLNP